MELTGLSNYKNIIIQCHDNPDADSIGSGFALQCFLRGLGSEAQLVYGGRAEITKPNLLMMLEGLGIEIHHLTELPPDIDLLITVDCQRGAGNAACYQLPPTADVFIIDHHHPEVPMAHNTIIRPALGSCATLVWDSLNKERFEMSPNIINALYFGLYTDTNGLSELRHPLDRDFAEIDHDTGFISKLKNSSIKIEELDIAAKTLQNREIIEGIGLFQAEDCDANLLGFTSDIARLTVGVDCCVVYCVQPHGVKLSIRSSVREIMASELAAFLCKDAGSGGGNTEKAGGYLSLSQIAEISDKPPESYLRERIEIYLSHYDHIYAGNNQIDFSALEMYKKLPRPVAFAKSTDIFPSERKGGTKITVRTLEGDIDTAAKEDIYLMIGILGEVYPIKRERFEADYDILDITNLPEREYTPIVLNRNTGERREVYPHAKSCVPKRTKLVRAIMLEKPTKVFTEWDLGKYFTGEKGDWLAANEGSYDDCYIVRGDIFNMTYSKAD